MNYKERLNVLLESKVDMKIVDSVKDVDLKFDIVSTETVKEFRDIIMRIMREYDIGKKISKRFWGERGYKDIQSTLYDAVKQQFSGEKPKNVLQLYDDLKTDVNVKGRSNYDISRVARTEGKAMSIIYQLEGFRKAGVKWVTYVTRGDKKVRPEHQILNGREYEINYLLSPEGEKDRIPISPNCRCRYNISWRGIR
jgi:SPP1 gp7 family putative phage head morphogenesis protein